MSQVLELSPEQKTAHEAILAFVKDKKPQLTIGGYAGTGKTFLVAHSLNSIREIFKNKIIALACFTGKAAYVLRDKLDAAGALQDEYVGTIHGLMYEPVVKNGVILRWKRRAKIDADLIIVDEASMVGGDIYEDLRKYKVPMLFVGDHGQLPPINGSFSLMQKPDHALTVIQRQAADNPIIALSQHVRLNGYLPSDHMSAGTSDYGWQRRSLRLHDLVELVRDPGQVMFLTGYNKTRTWLNRAIRHRLGFKEATPQQGEKLICLKNNREEGIFNGMGGILEKIVDPGGFWFQAEVKMEDGTLWKGWAIKEQFGAEATLRELKGLDPRQLRELFDWGYALTVHKAQGSEADRVVLVEERFSSMSDDDWRRWLYTGITRARKHLTVISRRFS